MAWDALRITVDALVLHRGKLVLVRRGKEPFFGMYALPGGFVEFGERLEEAVEREVQEETGLHAEVTRLVGVYGNPKRDPRGHTISVAYELKAYGGRLAASTDAAAVRLVPMNRVPRLAFDHATIVADYRRRLRA
ncbi:MAG: NUDIX hydrolase [Euryarchaeota archaeon]|nr:NUDIX hydrolase [Euryarchaeota archaeon]